ncbi:hypothetical protein M8J75_000374 [Diaphorina citri]|nr:hypothetical protein M8J75_000374 [Diaphorina citri]
MNCTRGGLSRRKIKERLGIGAEYQIVYQSHRDTASRTSSTSKNSFTLEIVKNALGLKVTPPYEVHNASAARVSIKL